MKTKPTEALKLIDDTESIVREIEVEAVTKLFASLACKLAFKEGQSNPKIKQLEWEERKFCYIARTAFGFYRILDASTLEKKQSCVLYFGETAQKVSIGTYEECIKNAQADFEKRLKKCLIIEL